ncbi:MAG: glycosyltransferase [Gemmatimonadetes bacterium]|nr:glycosyltransferase [Gemmatimonadota bacterium]
MPLAKWYDRFRSQAFSTGAAQAVSIIIPARDAADTLSDTLESLLEQTFTSWEAIVVDDGSSDGTAALAEAFATRDSRIRAVSQPATSVGAARNRGIAMTSYDWLLFLDADDWLLPSYLQHMTAAIQADPRVDVVHCGWSRVAPGGEIGRAAFAPERSDPFILFTRYCAIAVPCACVVRREVVEAVGCFDIANRTARDWDLWQRIARGGSRFGAIREVLARYRMRPDSASMSGSRILADGLEMIELGHSADPRVPHARAEYAKGAPRDQVSSARLYFVCWAAGLVLGGGDDARHLLNEIRDDIDPQLDPDIVAAILYEATLLPTCRVPEQWGELWPVVEEKAGEFLTSLEEQAGAPMLARQAGATLVTLIAGAIAESLPH